MKYQEAYLRFSGKFEFVKEEVPLGNISPWLLKFCQRAIQASSMASRPA